LVLDAVEVHGSYLDMHRLGLLLLLLVAVLLLRLVLEVVMMMEVVLLLLAHQRSRCRRRCQTHSAADCPAAAAPT
jgi:hypothetical protein